MTTLRTNDSPKQRGSGCRETTLGELCDGELGAIQTGPFGSQLHASDYRDSGIPVVNPTHLRTNAIDETELPRIDKADADRLSRHYLREGDILISRRGDFSRYAYIGTRQSGWLCGTGCLLIRLNNPKVDNRFLSFLMSFETVQDYLRQAAVGSIMPNLNTQILTEMPLLVPPLAEQRAIVKLLEAIQSSMNVRARELALERERKAALIEYLFAHGTRGGPTKQTEIGEIPESWQVTTIGDCAELITKGSSPNWQGFEYTKDGIAFVRSQNIGWGRLELQELARLSPDFNAKEKRSILRSGDLLINIVGASIGRAALATDSVDGGNVNQAVAVVRLRKPEFEPDFFMNFIFTDAGQVQLDKQKKDIARANLSLEDIACYHVPLPPVAEQRVMASLFNVCHARIGLLEREIDLLEELFQAMLEELMAGRLPAVPLIEEHQPQ